METLCSLYGDDSNEQGLPPGFRFHPTDEELITFYLASKVFNGSFTGVDIAEIDLNRCEPWELPDIAKMGEKQWYFFSLRDRKYPTGLRTNRATEAGYWKATGKDREIYSASTGALVGMKKTLVFYRGRAPKGEKTNWVMHEYRLDGYFSCCHSCKEEWVICRVLQKNASEKKIQIFHNQSSYFLEIPSPANLPPFLESPTLESSVEISVNHYTIPRENDVENYFNPTIQTIPRSPIFPVDLPFSLVDCCSSKETSLIKLGKIENPSYSPFSLQEEPNSSNWFNRNKDLFHLSVSEFSSTNYAPAHSIGFQLDSPIIHGPSEMYQSSAKF